jgi:hypothetical protein
MLLLKAVGVWLGMLLSQHEQRARLPESSRRKALRGDSTLGYDGTQAPCCPSLSAGGGTAS